MNNNGLSTLYTNRLLMGIGVVRDIFASINQAA
jgi:hypothetical protein